MVTPLLLLASGALSSAQAADGAPNGLAVGLYAAHLATPAAADFPSEASIGGRARYRFADSWAFELAVGGYDEGLDPRLELQRFLGPDPYARVQMFAAGGYGVMVYDGTGHDLWDAGLGMNAEMWPAVDLRADLRYRVIRTPGTETWPKAMESGFFPSVGLELHEPRVRPPPPPPPDSDGDGFLDPVDACPMAPEDVDTFQDEDGCPDLDDDGDGIPDAADSCRTQPEDLDGFEDENGCPDNDNDDDRIPDLADAAPNAPETYNGYQDKDGAPDELPAEVVKFSGKIEGIKFETGKATIQKSSNKVLDEAAGVLTRFTDIRLEVQGHTDDVGDDAKNLDLSQRRAQAVVDYLVAKGVAADRLTPKGYGESKPVAPNDSSANRALNRRVEFLILKD